MTRQEAKAEFKRLEKKVDEKHAQLRANHQQARQLAIEGQVRAALDLLDASYKLLADDSDIDRMLAVATIAEGGELLN